MFPRRLRSKWHLAAAAETFGGESFVLEQLSIAEPLVLDSESEQTVASVVTPEGAGGTFQMFSRDTAGSDAAARWRLHASSAIVQDSIGDVSK